MRRWLELASPWLALLGLFAIFELVPSVLSRALRPAAELGPLLGAYVLSLHLRRALGLPLRVLLLAYATLLLLFRIDRAAMVSLMGQDPLIFDQLLMARHLFVLIADLWNWKLGVALGAVPFAVALLVWVVRKLLGRLQSLVDRPRAGAAAFGLLVLWCASTALAALPAIETPPPQWESPALVANLERSHGVYSSVQQQLSSSPYRAYDQLRLRRRPDVYLILLESYGRVTIDRRSMYKRWRPQIERMQQTLEANGWSSASAFTVAPVAGGRSWLAEASVLTGIHVDYEAVFHHLIGQIDRVPNLVSLLAKQGYHTMLLAPSDRVRKGVEEANYYNYHRIVRLNDLNYRGPTVGWGIVPDQYSLYHTDEHVLRTAPRPLFFNYHMVSSHAPWRAQPQLVDDWRTLSDPNGPDFSEPAPGALGMRMRRYTKRTSRFMNMGTLRGNMGGRYTSTVLYDLELLERYLPTVKNDALVIVMGDHQPPFVSPETHNFESVMHVFARDPELLREFKERGFKPGLHLTRKDSSVVRHEGLFSLVVRALVRCCGSGEPLPEYRPEGARF